MGNVLHTFRLLGNALYMFRYLVRLLGNTLYTFRWLGNAMHAYMFSIKDALKYSCLIIKGVSRIYGRGGDRGFLGGGTTFFLDH